jgi:hypothetical protein
VKKGIGMFMSTFFTQELTLGKIAHSNHSWLLQVNCFKRGVKPCDLRSHGTREVALLLERIRAVRERRWPSHLSVRLAQSVIQYPAQSFLQT